ncbi:YopR/YscH family type III secretion effector [Pseudomonas lundensis]|uniref:YopR/YscH family type III secretion effector n=1 Tax=Pseudomonas lundensis TaxID=86185 RepID=UPI00385F87F0
MNPLDPLTLNRGLSPPATPPARSAQTADTHAFEQAMHAPAEVANPVSPVALRVLRTLDAHRDNERQARAALKDLIKQEAPFAKQQQDALLRVLGEIKPLPDTTAASRVINTELRHVIPLAGMIDNLMRYTHKPDLES